GAGVFERWDAHIDRLVDHAAASRAVILGVSFGGLIATRYAARHPARVSALVLASAPSPRWQTNPRIDAAVRHPILTFPSYILGTVERLAPEIMASRPTWTGRAGVALRYAGRAVRFAPSPRRMASWVREWNDQDFIADCRAVVAPTLLTTGEEALDRVVPVSSTLDYLNFVATARHVTLARTGHLGFITRPREFAALVFNFLEVNET
ncbi:MAG: alpha/beta hydrolase, partial [Acidobacteriota bacterium]